MDNVEKQTDKKPLLPLYAILSEQSFLREQALERLRKRLADEGDLDFNYDHFDAPTAEPDAVVGAANTLPIASEHRLIIISNIHQAKKELLDALGEYAQSPSPTTVLAVAGEKLVKSTKLYKAISKQGGLVERTNPKKKELPGVVQSLFAAQGKKAPIDLASVIVESVGEDIESLNTAVIKTATYMGDRVDVTRVDIDAVVELSAEIKVWEFVEALQMRRCVDALATFTLLLKQDTSIYMVQPAIVRAVRELIIARTCLDAGDSSSQTAQALGKPDWLARKTIEGARKYSAQELRDGLSRLAELEHILKTSSDGEAAYQRWILEFCQ